MSFLGKCEECDRIHIVLLSNILVQTYETQKSLSFCPRFHESYPQVFLNKDFEIL